VAEQIASTSGIECRMVVIKTIGDHLQDRPLSEVGGKRLFVKEIEDALLRGEVDLAVHSSKDMPAALPTGLTIAGVLPRADPLDVVVLPNTFGLTPKAPSTLEDLVLHLGPAASIGTGSVRRIAFAARISGTLAPATCVPAPGQGIVAIEIREDNEQARRAAQAVDDAPTGAALRAERALVEALGGGCQTPIGAFAWTAGAGRLELIAAVAALDGSRAIRGNAHGLETEAAALGARLGAQLIADGAGEILIAASAATQQSQVAILKSATMTDD
jgi:hydroxymethylbilane synthase